MVAWLNIGALNPDIHEKFYQSFVIAIRLLIGKESFIDRYFIVFK